MIFPGSRLLHEGEAVDLAVMTDEIRSSSFSGHIVLQFQESLDLVIVSRGEFLKVIEQIGRRIMTTRKYREIWGKCQIKQGKMYVFELPPSLAARLRGLCHRRRHCAGGPDSCDIAEVILEQKESGLTGFVDCVASEGKGIMELQGGAITSCYFTEYHGLSWTGIDAFRRWHELLQQSVTPYSISVSKYLPDVVDSHAWDALLMEGMDEVRLPLRPVDDRLFAVFGKTAFEGEALFLENAGIGKAIYLIDGSVEISRRAGGRKQVLGNLGSGAVLGLSWLSGKEPPSMTGIAATNCRYLEFDSSQIPRIIYNSPAMAANLINKASAQLSGVTRRRMFFSEDPRLKDLEYHVFQVLNRSPERLVEGLVPGELLSELSRVSSCSLPEMDLMIRKLIGAGRIVLSSGRILPHPEEI
jgi:CRP-like cAMP-binding protein